MSGEILLSTFLGDFVEYEILLENGQTIQLNEYTKDIDGIRPAGQKVLVGMEPSKINLYANDTGEVLSC